MQQRTLRSTATATTSPSKKRKRNPETSTIASLLSPILAALSSKPDYGVLDQPVDNSTIRTKLKSGQYYQLSEIEGDLTYVCKDLIAQIPSAAEFWRFARSVLASTSRIKNVTEEESDKPDDLCTVDALNVLNDKAPPPRPYERQALYIQANGQPLFTSLSSKPVIDPILGTTGLAQPLNVIPLPSTPAPTFGAVSPGDNDIGRQIKRVFPEDVRLPRYPGLYYGNFASFAPTQDSSEQIPECDAYIQTRFLPDFGLDDFNVEEFLGNLQQDIEIDDKVKETLEGRDELGSICPENINCMLQLLQEMQSTRLRISQHSPVSEQEQTLANQIRYYLISRVLSLKPNDFGCVKKTILTEGKSYQGSLPPIQVPIAATVPTVTPVVNVANEDRTYAGTPLGRRTLLRGRK